MRNWVAWKLWVRHGARLHWTMNLKVFACIFQSAPKSVGDPVRDHHSHIVAVHGVCRDVLFFMSDFWVLGSTLLEQRGTTICAQPAL